MGGSPKPKKRPRNNCPLDPFQVLQLRRDATDSEILSRYQRLAVWHHPARTQHDGDDDDGWWFTVLAASYETLIDETSRTNVCRLLLLLQEDDDATTTAAQLSMKNLSSTSTTSLDDAQHYPEAAESLVLDESLQLMYTARRFQPFTDAYVVFEQVFGSSLGRSRRTQGEHDPFLRYHHHLQPPPRRSIVRSDSTLNLCTRRIGNRCLTRTVRYQPEFAVSVTSTSLGTDEDQRDEGNTYFFCCSSS